jgi:ABC-type multidrug transport system ATPase subunit
LQYLYEDFTGYEFLMYIGLLKKVEKKNNYSKNKKICN